MKSDSVNESLSNNTKYRRKDWAHWIDADGDCQNTRAEILIRDSNVPVKFKRNKGCSVTWGKWLDLYTERTFTKASDVDIDHIAPLSHAYRNGGVGWSRSLKRQFANEPMNLLAVDDATNQAKGDKGPDQWMPPLRSYWCSYAEQWVWVKQKYGLSVNPQEDKWLTIICR